MWEDPIVAEVHRNRAKLAAEHNFDVAAFFAGLRKRQAAIGERLVHPKERAEPSDESNRGSHSESPESAVPAALASRSLD